MTFHGKGRGDGQLIHNPLSFFYMSQTMFQALMPSSILAIETKKWFEGPEGGP